MSVAAPWANTSRDRACTSRYVHSTMPNHIDATTAPVAIVTKSMNWLIVWSKVIALCSCISGRQYSTLA